MAFNSFSTIVDAKKSTKVDYSHQFNDKLAIMLKLLGAVAICSFRYLGAERVNVVLIGYYFIFQCSYNVENAEFAIKKLAQTTMRSEIGKITLDTVFREREILNVNIVGKFSS